MDNSPLAPKPGPVIYGQFIVQKSVFFGVTKRLLTIKEDRIELNALNFDGKHKEVFSFNDIGIIQTTPNNETQFSISLKKHVTIVLSCQNRTQCISEIYRTWDWTSSQKIQSHHQSAMFPSYQVFKKIIPGNDDTYIETKIILYKTHLELVHQSLKCPPEKVHLYGRLETTENVVESTVSIPFYLIETIYKTHKGIVIEMRDSMAKHDLLFYDLEMVNNLLNRMQKNFKEYVDCLVEINEEMFEEGLPLETVVPKSYELFFFHTKAFRILESGHLMPIKIALSDSYLVEIDIEEELVIQKYDLSAINHVVRMVSGIAGIQVTFEDFTIITYVPPHHHKGLLASNLFTLANWKKNTQEYLIQNDFIHSMVPKYNYIVHGWINNIVESDYETELIRAFTNAPADDSHFYTALHEFNVNARLRNYTSTDNTPLKILIQRFNKNIKIIMTKEFISYWETFQTYVANRCKPDFEDQTSSEKETGAVALTRADSSLSPEYGAKTPEEKLKHLLNKFQFEIAELFPNIRFSTKTLPLILYRTEEILKGISILISSKGLFKELAGNKRESSLYENFVFDVARLIDSPYPSLSHLAGCFFRALCRFYDNTESKLESINKNFVLTSKVNLMQNVSEILAKRVLIQKKDHKEHENIYILSILACLRIIKTFVYERKDTTNPEDLQMILKYISKPYYFAIFNFLSRYRSIACVYNTTIILNSFFKNCTSRESYRSLQNRFLNNSSLILLHTNLVLSSLAVLQRKISVVLLSHLFFDNANACGLICRIFPKNLFRKVDFMSNDITKWTLLQWEQFFSLAIKDFNTTTEIWTSECREELVHKLRALDEDINSKFNNCPANRIQELFNKNNDEGQGEFLLNIRWNHEEFEMKYDFLQYKIPVGKYYLTTLLQDSEQPKLAAQMSNPAKLWNELSIRFIGATKVEEMAIILKVMILIYRDYFSTIRDLNTMNHWLKCLRTKEYKQVWYLILQLLYTSITVDDYATRRFNTKKFVDSEGIPILADVLSGLYFIEDHNEIDAEANAIYKNNPRDDMDYNYTKLTFSRQAYSPSLEKSCMTILIVNILKGIVYRYRDEKVSKQIKFVYPIPTAKFHILELSTLQCLVNMLLMKDDDLNVEVLEFLTECLCDKFNYRSITEGTPIYEFILFNTTRKTLPYKLELLTEIYNRVAEESETQEDSVRLYTSFTFKNITSETVEDAILQFPILKYIPKHFVWMIVNNQLEKFADIYFSNSDETPQLIWNSYLRETLANAIEIHLQEYIYDLVKFSESKKITFRDQIPQYPIGTFDIIYDKIQVSILLNLLYVTSNIGGGSLWSNVPSRLGFKKSNEFKIAPEEVPIFLGKLSILLRKYLAKPLSEATSSDFYNLLIILKAHAKAIKAYSITKYDCFGEILTILRYLPEKISHWDPIQESVNESFDIAEYIQTLCKLIFRAIRLEDSQNAILFARTKGIEVFLLILTSLVHRINIQNNTQSSNYYTDIQIAYEDLKILDRIIRIIVKMIQKSYDELSSLSQYHKLQLFLNLRIVSKIPLTLFEYVRTNHITAKTTNFIEINDDNDANPAATLLNFEGEVVENYDTVTTSVFEVIAKQPEGAYADICITKIFIIAKNLLDLLSELSVDVQYTANFIQSGLAWRFLEFLTYYNEIGVVSEATHNPHYQTMLINVEKIANVFRNIVIYSNEAFIWKVVGASNEINQMETVISSKEQSAEVSSVLTKIDSAEKNLLCQFYEGVLNLLGKRLLQILLADYTQPHVSPKDKDVTSIKNFLNFFSNELHEPTSLWNNDTRLELKNLLIQQIMLINSTDGKDFLNLIEKFKYTLHQRNLLINEIFVKLIFFQKFSIL